MRCCCFLQTTPCDTFMRKLSNSFHLGKTCSLKEYFRQLDGLGNNPENSRFYVFSEEISFSPIAGNECEQIPPGDWNCACLILFIPGWPLSQIPLKWVICRKSRNRCAFHGNRVFLDPKKRLICRTGTIYGFGTDSSQMHDLPETPSSIRILWKPSALISLA